MSTFGQVCGQELLVVVWYVPCMFSDLQTQPEPSISESCNRHACCLMKMSAMFECNAVNKSCVFHDTWVPWRTIPSVFYAAFFTLYCARIYWAVVTRTVCWIINCSSATHGVLPDVVRSLWPPDYSFVSVLWGLPLVWHWTAWQLAVRLAYITDFRAQVVIFCPLYYHHC